MFSPSILNSPTSFVPDSVLVDTIFQSISEKIDISQAGTVNIAFLDDEEIRALNLAHRWIDSTTDVLSFHYFEDFEGLKDDEVAWEIILSESKIISQAKEYGNTLQAEFAKLLSHSVLHLLGYDHETDEEYIEMREQEEIIEKILLEKMNISIQ